VLEGLPALLVLVPIGFLGATIYGITGFGSALVTIPLATHFVPLPYALAVFALMDLSNALRVAWEGTPHRVNAEVARIVPFIAVGIVLGTTLLVNLPRDASMAALGCFVLLFGLWSLVQRGTPRKLDTRWAYLAGFAGGVLGMLFGAGGAPYAIYLANRGLTKEQYRSTLSLTSVFSIGIRVVALVAAGLLLRTDVLLAAAAVVPAALLALKLASRLFRRISRELLMRLVALLLVASGASLIARALS